MPLMGYLGFPPFAVQSFTLTSVAVTLWDRASIPAKLFLVVAAVAFSLSLVRSLTCPR